VGEEDFGHDGAVDKGFFGAAKHDCDFVFAVKFEEFGGEVYDAIDQIEQHA